MGGPGLVFLLLLVLGLSIFHALVDRRNDDRNFCDGEVGRDEDVARHVDKAQDDRKRKAGSVIRIDVRVEEGRVALTESTKTK